MILYDQWFYERLAPAIRGFRFGPRDGEDVRDTVGNGTARKVDTILFGLGRYGRNLAQELQSRGHSVLGVDFDPERVKLWQGRGLATVYGDLDDCELFHTLPLDEAQWVVSTIPDLDKASVLLHALAQNEFSGKIAITADTMQHKEQLLSAGADVVLLPFRDAAVEAADMLTTSATRLP